MPPELSPLSSNLARGGDAERALLVDRPSWTQSLQALERIYDALNAHRAEAKGSPSRRRRFLEGCTPFGQLATLEVLAFMDAGAGERCWYLSFDRGAWLCRLYDDASVCTGLQPSVHCTYVAGTSLA